MGRWLAPAAARAAALGPARPGPGPARRSPPRAAGRRPTAARRSPSRPGSGDITRLDAGRPGRRVAGHRLRAARHAHRRRAGAARRRAARAGCPVLLTLSVVGRVELAPADPLDAAVAAAFNAHQRRTAGGRRLLGPDAVGGRGGRVRPAGADGAGPAEPVAARRRPRPRSRPSGSPAGSARRCEQRPELAAAAPAYAAPPAGRGARRAARRSTVHHVDLLALPRRPREPRAGRATGERVRQRSRADRRADRDRR